MSDPIPLAADVFYCPVCGQKHRGDLSVPRSGAEVLARCAGCGTKLWIRWKSGHVSVKPAAQRNPGVKEVDTLDLKIPVNLSRTAALVASTVLPPRVVPSAPVRADERAGQDPVAGIAPAQRASRSREAPPPAPRAKEPAPAEPAEAERVSDAEFASGTMIGRYRVESAAGRGGTAAVYQAFDATTNRYVALKVLGRDQPEAMRQRFLREIEVEANLRHPNLMPVFDRGEHEGRPFFAMEMLYRPFTLTEIVRMARDGTISRYVTLKEFESFGGIIRGIFLPVCAAMQVANVENGVVHRDLKPDNILVDSRTLRPYVIDFGICHVLERRERVSRVTIAPTADEAGIVGTPRYLAPEQARGTVHERTDVWGLGAILRFCLTGEAPIAPANLITRAELKRRIQALTQAQEVARSEGNEAKAALCSEKLARLEDTGLRTYDDIFEDARDGVYMPLPPEIPPVASAILRKAMAPRPGDRYESPRALAEDVAAWLAGTPIEAPLEHAVRGAGLPHRAAEILRRHAVLAVAVTAVATAVLSLLLGVVLPGARARNATAAAWDQVLSAAESQVEASGRVSPSSLSPAEAASVHDALVRGLIAQSAALAALPEGSEREAALVRLRAITARIAPQEIEILPAPADGVSVEDVSRHGPSIAAAAGGLALPPGEYRLHVAGVRVPLVIPFLVRPRGAKPGDGRHVLRVPSIPASTLETMALVVPDPADVVCRRPPWAPVESPPSRVTTFLIDRHEVSNGEWAVFLEALTDNHERERRVPNSDFTEDPARPRHYVIQGEGKDAERTRDLPVRGISPADAAAYCAWRSRKEGGTVRLPTEEEWVVAAGLQLGRSFPGETAGPDDSRGLSILRRVSEVPDVSPHGVSGMLGNVREIVLAKRVEEDGRERYVTKGGCAGGTLGDALLLRVREIAEDTREDRTGFRCVREVR